MEKCIIWFFLSLKENIKKRDSWLAVLGMLFLVWIVSGISIPSYKNMQVGIWCGSSQTANQIKEELVAEKNAFEFVEYRNKDELYGDVTSGKIDCGFIFEEDFDEKINERNSKNLILYLSTPYTSKGEVLKETVYSVLFKLYSENILSSAEIEIYGEHDENRMEQLLERNQKYQEGNEVFQIQIKEVQHEVREVSQQKTADMISGLIGLFVFLTMFLAYGKTQLGENDNVELALGKMERWCYRYIKMLAAAFIPAAAGIILLVNRSQSQGFCMESAGLALFILLSAVWINIFGRTLGRAEHLPTWILSLTLIHLIICPGFFDCSQYVPAITGIRYLLPLSWYQMW